MISESMNEGVNGVEGMYERMEDIENNTYVYTTAKMPWRWRTQT